MIKTLSTILALAAFLPGQNIFDEIEITFDPASYIYLYHSADPAPIFNNTTAIPSDLSIVRAPFAGNLPLVSQLGIDIETVTTNPGNYPVAVAYMRSGASIQTEIPRVFVEPICGSVAQR